MRVMSGACAVHRFNMNPMAARQNGNALQAGMPNRRDTVSISSQGRTANLISNLMEQREAVVERKNSLLASSAEEGTPLEAIKTQLETYQEQIESIDKQISDIHAMQRKAEIEKKPKEKTEKEPKTEKEAENKKISSLTKLSVNMDSMDVVNSVKSHLDGDIRVLESEVKLDKMYNKISSMKMMVISKYSRPSQPTSEIFLSAKEAHISELKSMSDDLSADLAKEIGNANETIRENNALSSSEKEKDKEEQEKQPSGIDLLA